MYSGICPCGGPLKDSSHTVKTIEAAQNWFPNIELADLPVLILQRTCQACGRLDKSYESTITRTN